MCTLEKTLHSSVVEWRILYKFMRIIDSRVVQVLCIYSLIFCLGVLYIIESWVLKSPTVIVELSIYPFSSINVCFIYFGAPLLD